MQVCSLWNALNIRESSHLCITRLVFQLQNPFRGPTILFSREIRMHKEHGNSDVDPFITSGCRG
jgi:hypothetical protein